MSSPCTRSVQLVNTLRGPGAPAGMPPFCAALRGSPEAQGCRRQGHLPSALLRKWGSRGCVHACVHVNTCSWVCGCAWVYRGGMCTYVGIRACVFCVCVFTCVCMCVCGSCVSVCSVMCCVCVDVYGWTGSRSPSLLVSLDSAGPRPRGFPRSHSPPPRRWLMSFQMGWERPANRLERWSLYPGALEMSPWCPRGGDRGLPDPRWAHKGNGQGEGLGMVVVGGPCRGSRLLQVHPCPGEAGLSQGNPPSHHHTALLSQEAGDLPWKSRWCSQRPHQVPGSAGYTGQSWDRSSPQLEAETKLLPNEDTEGTGPARAVGQSRPLL